MITKLKDLKCKVTFTFSEQLKSTEMTLGRREVEFMKKHLTPEDMVSTEIIQWKYQPISFEQDDLPLLNLEISVEGSLPENAFLLILEKKGEAFQFKAALKEHYLSNLIKKDLNYFSKYKILKFNESEHGPLLMYKKEGCYFF